MEHWRNIISLSRLLLSELICEYVIKVGRIRCITENESVYFPMIRGADTLQQISTESDKQTKLRISIKTIE